MMGCQLFSTLAERGFKPFCNTSQTGPSNHLRPWTQSFCTSSMYPLTTHIIAQMKEFVRGKALSRIKRAKVPKWDFAPKLLENHYGWLTKRKSCLTLTEGRINQFAKFNKMGPQAHLGPYTQNFGKSWGHHSPSITIPKNKKVKGLSDPMPIFMNTLQHVHTDFETKTPYHSAERMLALSSFDQCVY